MKITKRQLKQIIKEELENVLEWEVQAVNPGGTPVHLYCVGYYGAGDKIEYETVQAEDESLAARTIKRRHRLRDEHIVATREGRCDELSGHGSKHSEEDWQSDRGQWARKSRRQE